MGCVDWESAYPPLTQRGSVRFAAFSPDSRSYVITASSDGTARIWDVASGEAASPALRFSGIPSGVAFTSGDRVQVRSLSGEEEWTTTWALVSNPLPGGGDLAGRRSPFALPHRPRSGSHAARPTAPAHSLEPLRVTRVLRRNSSDRSCSAAGPPIVYVLSGRLRQSRYRNAFVFKIIRQYCARLSAGSSDRCAAMLFTNSASRRTSSASGFRAVVSSRARRIWLSMFRGCLAPEALGEAGGLLVGERPVQEAKGLGGHGRRVAHRATEVGVGGIVRRQDRAPEAIA